MTGEVGFEADRSEAVKSIDETLLLVTCVVLVLLLLAIYRSPLVALVPLLVVAIAYVVAGGLTYMLVRTGITGVSGQTTAILIVLMFGVGTDYCLLIVARFKDELRRTADVGEAMARATERTGPAILSAGAIVIVAMLVLTLADFNATREMGPILALGVAVMVAAGLTLLPAILATLGRRAFWPAVPQVEVEATPVSTVWRRVGRLVGSHPAAIAERRDAVPRRRCARRARRPRAAGLLRGLPLAAGIRRRRADDQRPLHPRSRRAAERRHGLPGARVGALCADDREPYICPRDVLIGRFSSPRWPGIRARARTGLSEDESFLG